MIIEEDEPANKLTYTILKLLKSHPSFKKEKENFIRFITEGAKIKINKELNYFLVYDLDRKRWSIQGEIKANYNHVTVMVGIIPSSSSAKEIEKQVLIEEYNFDNPQINKYSIYD